MPKSFEHKLLKNQVFLNPFNFTQPSLSFISLKIFFLLLIQLLCLVLTKSYASLFVALAALTAALSVSAILYLFTDELIYNYINVLNQGLIIGLLLPSSYPLITVFAIVFLTIIFSRLFIFKTINSWTNITAISVIIAWIIGKKFFPDFFVTSEILSLKNSSLYLIQNGSFSIYQFDNAITSFLNSTLFKLLKVTIPEGYISLLWDSYSIIPAFRFNFITIISSIILFSDNSFSGIIPSIFLVTYGIFVRIFVPAFFGGDFFQGDILLSFLTSGVLFSAVFMIQFYGTIPSTITGKFILGIITGIVGFLIMGCGTSPIGMVYTILVSNIFNMIIRLVEEKQNLKTRSKVLIKLNNKEITNA